ncbi:MAG: cytochrome c [Planctomycetes bacterium]|nr:cytochrome c [Planctomycetota bacterium]
MILSRSLVAVSTALALVGCLLLASCPGSNEPVAGKDLFVNWGCANCHAAGGTGIQGLGPSLQGKAVNWTRESLTEYLRDPTGYAAKNPRLKEQGRGYMTPMPPILTKDEAAVARLVDHVLALP